MAQIVFEMTANEKKAAQALDSLVGKEKKVEQGLTKISGAGKKAERELKRFADRTNKVNSTPLEKYKQTQDRLNQALQKGMMNQTQYGRAVEANKRKLQTTTDAMKNQGKAADSAFGPKALGMLRTFAGAAGLGSIAGIVSTIAASFMTWRDNMKDVGAETSKAANEMIAFAALQEGGTKAKRVGQAMDLATRFGVLDRGEAFNTVQSLQSARGGDFQAGMKSAETVFAATQLAISLDKATELEVIGASLAAEPGDFVRKAYIAGNLSPRTPEAIAGAASGLSFFDDENFGFATAAAISGSVDVGELGTYLKATGRALSKVSPLADTFKELGLGDLSQSERLDELVRRGLNTPEKLADFGVSDVRGQKGVAALVKNAGDMPRFMSEISQVKEGVFGRDRSKLESELPIHRQERLNAIAMSRARDAMANNPDAGKLKEREIHRDILLRDIGKTQILAVPLVDNENRSTQIAQGFVSSETAVKNRLDDQPMLSAVSALNPLAGVVDLVQTIRQSMTEFGKIDKKIDQLIKETHDLGKINTGQLKEQQKMNQRAAGGASLGSERK